MEKQIKQADPTPLGLLGFGMATLLLNLDNVGIIKMTVVVVGMAIALGGVAQLIAGFLHYRNGNTFGGTSSTAFSLFWFSLIFIWYNPSGEMLPVDDMSMGFYLLIWAIFTLCMFICSLKMGRLAQITFLALTILLFGLAISDFTGIEAIAMYSGWVGILGGCLAIYNSVALVINDVFEREVFPLGKQ